MKYIYNEIEITQYMTYKSDSSCLDTTKSFYDTLQGLLRLQVTCKAKRRGKMRSQVQKDP